MIGTARRGHAARFGAGDRKAAGGGRGPSLHAAAEGDVGGGLFGGRGRLADLLDPVAARLLIFCAHRSQGLISLGRLR